MVFRFVLFSSCNEGPFGNLGTKLWKTKRTFAKCFLETFGYHNFSYIQLLSSVIIISLNGLLLFLA